MKVCTNLKRLESLTYQFPDDQADMPKNLFSKVQDLYTDFRLLLPQKASLVLRPKRSQGVVIMRRKIQKALLTLACLSISTTVKGKKKTKALNPRVGSKADWKRKLQVCVCLCVCMRGCMCDYVVIMP